uniref:A-kinase anchor protein 7-like phosphoesterase domain-containing protein n=1 Tax=Ditylenchus dipsaci TaxID=166011 RepID=A0A915ETJ2_9BILA
MQNAWVLYQNQQKMEKANAGDRRSFLHRLGQELMQPQKDKRRLNAVFSTTDYQKIESAGQQIHNKKQERHRRLYIVFYGSHSVRKLQQKCVSKSYGSTYSVCECKQKETPSRKKVAQIAELHKPITRSQAPAKQGGKCADCPPANQVSSNSSDSVRMCKKKMQSLLDGDGSGKSTSPTHFVSVELSNDVLRKAYTELVENIRTDESIPEQCQEKSLFRPVEKLHLTISVLRLPTEEDKEVAKKCVDGVFQKQIREILEHEHQIPVQFDGLDFFGYGSSKANVIFAKIVSDKLQQIANAIDDSLFKTGLAEKRKTEDVKLHLTLINTKNAKKGFKYRKINASALLEKFGDFKFDSVMVNEVKICCMREVDPSTNGYQAIHSVKL